MASYRDQREDAYRMKFFEHQFNLDRRTLTESATTVQGRNIRKLSIEQLFRIIEQQDEQLRVLRQDISSLRGQFEFIHNHGLEAYDSEIDLIKETYPKP